MNKLMTTAALAALTSLSVATVANAQVIYDSVGFESLAGWTTTTPTGQVAGAPPTNWIESTSGAAPTAVVQTAVINEGTQAIQLDRVGDGDGFFGPNLAPTPITDPTDTQRFIDISWSMNVTDVGDNVPAPFFGVAALLRLDGAVSTNRVVNFGVDARDLESDGFGSVNFFYDNGAESSLVTATGDGVEVPLGSWFDMLLRVDTLNDTVQFFVNDATGDPLAEAFPDPGNPASDPDLGGTVTGFTTAVLVTDDLFGDPDSPGTAYYDQFAIGTIPEPATLGLLGLAGLGLLRRRTA